MKNNDTLSIKTIEALHNCVAIANPDISQIDELILEIGKAIDEAKVEEKSTLLLQRLYEEVIWLKSEISY